jgi:hypothetical protein
MDFYAAQLHVYTEATGKNGMGRRKAILFCGVESVWETLDSIRRK